MYVPKSDIVMLDMTIEEGAKLIVSAGLVAPEVKPKLLNGETLDGPSGPAADFTDLHAWTEV